MLVERIAAAEYPQLLRDLRFREQICFNSLRTSLTFHLAGLLEGVDLRVWRCQDADKLVYATVHMVCGEVNRIVIESNSTETDFNHQSVALIADDVYEAVANHDLIFVYATELNLSLEFQKHLVAKGTHPYKWLDEKAILYHSNAEQRRALAAERLQLPDDFAWGSLKQENAAELAADHPCRRVGGKVDFIQQRLLTLPSTAIVHKPTGEMAAFESVDGIGYVASRYTRCKFRAAQLCVHIEKAIAQKCWTEFEVIPMKTVSFGRCVQFECTERSPIWSKVLSPNGFPLVVRYLVLSRQPGPQLEYFESVAV